MLRSFLMLAAFWLHRCGPWRVRRPWPENRLSAEYLAIFHTGVTYQLVHTLALFGVALLAAHIPGRLVSWAGISFTVGILLFSGSLYVLTMTGISKLGIITPFGGLAFLLGWFSWGWLPGACRRSDRGTWVINLDRARMRAPKTMAARGMRIQLNGESFELPDGETVAALLTRLDLTGRRVAVELNLDIVPRSLHAETALTEGDQVEVVHAIGGG